jgi:hypothetical protein
MKIGNRREKDAGKIVLHVNAQMTLYKLKQLLPLFVTEI